MLLINQKNNINLLRKENQHFEKMKEARKKKIEEMRNRKNDNNEKIPPPPKLKRSKAIDMKQEITKSSSSESSTFADSSNCESDEKTEKVIIHNYDEKETESKLIIKKVKSKNKVNNEELIKYMMK